MRATLVCLCLGVFAGSVHGNELVATHAELPPLRDIALSPDGQRAVALRAIDETYHAVLLDFAAGTQKLLMASDPEEFLFNWCEFANNTRIVCSIRKYIVLRAGQVDGRGPRAYRDGRTVATRLLAVDIDGDKQLQLVPQATYRPGNDLVWNAPDQDNVISWMRNDAKHILVSLARDDRIHPSVYRLNIYNNRMKRIQGHLPSVYQWFADDAGVVRLGAGYRQRREPVAYALLKGKKRTPVDLAPLAGLDQPRLARLVPGEQHAWVLANNGRDTVGVHKVDIASGRHLEALYEHPRYDVTGLRTHPRTGAVLYAIVPGEQEPLVWFDDALRKRFAQVRQALGSPRLMRIVSSDATLARVILYVEGNGVTPTHYLYTLESDSLVALAQGRTGPPVAFEAVTFPARDGTEIPAFLALPGPRDDGPYPTVITPHGGPWSRSDGHDWFIANFLVARGYAVLQPNFRGSTGFGDKWVQAGFEQWGLRMQDDVIDGLDWMVEELLADPARICISGGSYGGYVALVAAYKTPERLQCAVSFAGVGNLRDLVERTYLYELGRFTAARIQSGAALAASNPIDHVDKVGVPVLLVHGDVDTTVVIEQSRDFAAALQAAGKPHRFIEQRNGDHHFSLASHRRQYLEALDAFLAEHLTDPETP